MASAIAAPAPAGFERILFIDPGPKTCGLALLDVPTAAAPLEFGPDTSLPRLIVTVAKAGALDAFAYFVAAAGVVVEMVACYGMPVGAEVFETVMWIGEYRREAGLSGRPFGRLTRAQVKMALCGRTAGVNDSVLRQRLIDIYGGRAAAIGRKAAPGPLYAVKADGWAALALGFAYWRLRGKAEQ